MKRIGVVIGRFQTSALTIGHQWLIQQAREKEGHACVVLGISRTGPTRRDPLPFEIRRNMVIRDMGNVYSTTVYPDIDVLGIQDQEDVRIWSDKLDRMLKKAYSGYRITLYEGRDGFSKWYTGKLKVKTLNETISKGWSGTASRERTVEYVDYLLGPNASHGSSIVLEGVRKGIIYATYKTFPRTFMTVDIAILRKTANIEVLMARKDKRLPLRFPGGFVDPSDDSLETAAMRECKEETGIKIDKLVYATSMRVKDWRYERTPDKITTALFAVMPGCWSGDPKAGDDISEVEWVPTIPKYRKDIVETHQLLFDRLLHWMPRHQKVW